MHVAPICATPERALLDMVCGIWGCMELVPVLEYPLGRVREGEGGLRWYNNVPLWYHCARLQPLSKNSKGQGPLRPARDEMLGSARLFRHRRGSACCGPAGHRHLDAAHRPARPKSPRTILNGALRASIGSRNMLPETREA